jgi:two-component system, NarL family, nitrate/nitrite response regulator NarL
MKILVVDDHPLTCIGLIALLQSAETGAQITSVHSALECRERLVADPHWDWIFLDMNLSDDPHQRLFREMCDSSMIAQTVIISADISDDFLRRALERGARGFIPKSANPERFLESFAQIQAGVIYIPLEFQDRLAVARLRPDRVPNLSPRLVQVHDLMLHGAPNKVIAKTLGISPNTVKEYVSLVLAKHGVASRLELVLKERGLSDSV